MKSSTMKVAILIAMSLVFSACGGSSDDDGGGGGVGPQGHQVDWSSIPAEYNPSIEEVDFVTEDIERVEMNVFGFRADVGVSYSSELAPNSGYLRIYKVWKESVSWGNIRSQQQGESLKLSGQGSYQCSIQIKDHRISSLKGGCYLRIEIVLPAGAKIEVYNVGQRLSKRFFAISTERFLEDFDDAPFSADKFAVIKEYLKSYKEVSQTPRLSSEQLGTVIEDFLRSEEKFEALRLLHSYVSDRGNLNAMIDREFSSFDQDEARRIAGL